MKKRLLIIAGAIILAFSYSCDVIEAPYEEEGNVVIIDTTKKNVLLEEYTGHRCGNCPEANDIAHELEKTYDGSVILVSIHATGLAKPTFQHQYDFRTTVGNELADYFEVELTPTGLVNRSFFNGQYQISPTAWDGAIQNELAKNAQFNIEMESSYDEQSRVITANVEIKCVNGADYDDHFVLFITEDDYIGYQKDDRLTNVDVYDYEHDNVLRASFNGTWGDPLTGENVTIPPGESVTKELKFTVPADVDWTVENLNLVGFVTDYITDEVYQAEKIRVIEQ
jgi:thiol-disulfide isomerase/thioredoxin